MKNRKLLYVLSALSLVFAFSILLSGCGSSDQTADSVEATTASAPQTEAVSIDENCLETIDGGYNCSGIYSGSEKIDDKAYLHLEIMKEFGDTDSPYLSIYDQSAGNPGVEGQIVYLDDTTIKIKVDKDLYEELPSDDWTLVDDTYLEMTYAMAQMGIVLSNNDIGASFWFEDIDRDSAGDEEF